MVDLPPHHVWLSNLTISHIPCKWSYRWQILIYVLFVMAMAFSSTENLRGDVVAISSKSPSQVWTIDLWSSPAPWRLGVWMGSSKKKPREFLETNGFSTWKQEVKRGHVSSNSQILPIEIDWHRNFGANSNVQKHPVVESSCRWKGTWPDDLKASRWNMGR